MLKRSLALAGLAVLLALALSGCSLKSPEELYQLPQPPPDYEHLQQAITLVQQELSTQYSTPVEYAAPLSGSNTQTLQLQDLNNDGIQESALAFFRVPGAENPLMIYIFRQQPDDSYAIYTVIEGGGSAINSISYEELDDTPGRELVVHWQMNGDVHQLGVYSIAQDMVHPLLITSYSHCQVMDLDRDGRKELLLFYLDPATSSGYADYYDYQSELDALALTSSAPLSRDITGVKKMVDNYVQDMIPALYVSSSRADGDLITDVLLLQEDGLTNITLDPELGTSTETMRLKEIYGNDINNDSILELPFLTFLPEYGQPPSSNYWIINWRQYDTEGTAHPVYTTYHTERNGWYLVLPDSWLGQLTITASDKANLGERSVTFSRWSGASTEEPESFLTIHRLTGSNRRIRADLGTRFILLEDSTTIYAAEFHGTWDCGLDEESLLENFNLIRTEW